MIPITLTLAGVHSYQSRQTIDFTALTEAGLFGIFGPVGSGKSTILEAITFALYGDIERLNRRDNVSYNMMNLKSNEMLIDFVFSTGADNQRYRFNVSGKRNRTNFERVPTYARAAYRWIGEQWVPLESTHADELLGLSYEHFCRTVIIPQGKFQEFLQLEPARRTQMLKDLFGLHQYELFNGTRTLELQTTERQHRIEGELTALGQVDTQVLEQERLRGEQLAEQYQVLGANLDTLRMQEESQRLAAQRATALHSAQQRLVQLQSQHEGVVQRERVLGRYTYCLVHFRDLLARAEELQAQYALVQRTFSQTTQQSQDIAQELAQQHVAYEAAVVEREGGELQLRKADELDEVVQLRTLEEQLAVLHARVAGCQTDLEQALVQYEQLRGQERALRDEQNALQGTLMDSELVASVKEWFVYKRNCVEKIARHEQRVGEFAEQVDELRNRLRQLRGDDSQALTQFEKTLASQLSSSAELEEQLREKIAALQLQEKLRLLVEGLEEGCACPLCGAVEHPRPSTVEGVAQQLAVSQEQLEQAKGETQRLRATAEQVQATNMRLALLESSLHQEHEACTRARSELKVHAGRFRWSGFAADNEEQFNEAVTASEASAKALRQISSRHERCHGQLLELESRLPGMRQALAEARERRSSVEGLWQSRNRQFFAINYEHYRTLQPEAIQQESEQIRGYVVSLEQRVEQAQVHLAQLQRSSEALAVRGTEQQSALEGVAQQQRLLDEKIAVQLSVWGEASLEEIRAILREPLDVEQEQQRIALYQRELHAAERRVGELLEQVAAAPYDAKEHERISQQLLIVQQEFETIQQQRGACRNRIEEFEAALARKNLLLVELGQLKARLDDILVLKGLFKGSGFVNYVSTVFLQELCHAANSRFVALTRKQLRLELSESNAFIVRDFLNEGRTRSAKTLSGGQIFQASLCLALALVERLQRLAGGAGNFFFLDEGFGSQDRESLQLVLETLRALRKEKRIVGVISHVEELQQDIDAYLSVHRDEERGSLITASWERKGIGR